MKKWLTIMFVLPGLLNCGDNTGNTEQDVKILVVHSYHIEYAWTKSIHDGINYVLKDKGYTLDTIFMDTKRNTGEPFKTAAGQNALNRVDVLKPDVVIATDDNAQEYVGKFLVNRDDVSLVFCGVNMDMKTYNYPAANVTGVLERPSVRSTLNLLQKVAPEVRTVTVFTDKSPTSKGFIEYITGLDLEVTIDTVFETDDFDQWKEAFKTVTGDAVVTYMYHTVRHRGEPVLPREVMKWTREHMNKPSVGFLYFSIEDGVLLGQVESGFEHGELAAKCAVEIVNGKKAGEIPVITATKGLVMVNDKTARQLGIDWSPIKNVTDRVVEQQER